MSEAIPVIIIGAGLTGLTSASLLAHHGVQCKVIERHAGTSIQYKFAGVSPRSMEVFRTLGLEAEIRANKTGDQQGGGIARGRSLSDPALTWSGPAWPDASALSPCQPATCDQYVLEPLLRAYAERHGAQVALQSEVTGLEQHARGVDVRVRDLVSGRERSEQARYVIIADGANGSARELLGIARRGTGVLQSWMNIIFDTDLTPYLGGQRFTGCFVTELNGTFTPRESGRWLLSLQFARERGESPAQFTADYCRELVRRGAGRDDVRADLVDAKPWDIAGDVVDRMQQGRCFLAGDAAHLMPPTGAFGGNTGIHDAHNLAWKLAFVLRGSASPDLLESYQVERLPLARATVDQALARLQRWFRDPGQRLPPAVPQVPDYDVVFGQRYRSPACADQGSEDERAFVSAEALSGAPGTRLPHAWLDQRSSLDACDRDLVLWSLHTGYREAGASLASRAPLRIMPGPSADARAFCERIGVGDQGAALVRPDGFVAWRSSQASADPSASLRAALHQLYVA